MKLAALTRYSRMGASSRVRMMQFESALASARIIVEYQPLFDDRYLERLYRGYSRFFSTLSAYTRRTSQLRMAGTADVIWLEKEALPWVPALFEHAVMPRNVPIVSDYDDAVFHRYDLHRFAIVRRLLGRKIDRIMAASALVMAGNAYLADRAIAAGARRVEIVPTVVDTDRYLVRPPPSTEIAPVIGWIGSPSTWQAYMVPILPMLLDIAERMGARLRVVCAGVPRNLHPLVDVLPWSEADEVEQIRRMDIGIMPLDDSPWARGKCGYKLIQYMACGVPVVASPVGVNTEIVEDGVNGFLVKGERAWREALATLLVNPDLRQRMGQAGRTRVEVRYSSRIWGKRIAEMFQSVITGR